MIKITAILTSFNRRELTLRCLRALFANVEGLYDLAVYLLDDNSTDGTREAVHAAFPTVHLLQGDGDHYWNRGMLVAWRAALESKPDFYLWVNDDSELRPGSIDDLLALQASIGPKTIVCGRIKDSQTGAVVYGGFRRSYGAHRIFGLTTSWPWPKRYLGLASDDDALVDTMHGNCVLIPSSAVEDIGLISEHYWHSDGDTDYGFRAINAGYKIAQLKEPVAAGDYNTDFDAKRQFLTPKNWRFYLLHPKGRRPIEAYHYYRQHIRPFWPIRLVWSYVGKMRLR